MTIDRRDVTFKSGDSFAAGWSIELIAPRPLLMILAKSDTISSSDLIRDAFARAGEPKRLLEVEGGHYSVYPWSRGQSAEPAGRAATDWFVDHLLDSTASENRGSGPAREPKSAVR